jgi:hypothetical protein
MRLFSRQTGWPGAFFQPAKLQCFERLVPE